ncbi:hypothetical protein IAD21_03178 [Abditibacteriota bacterium]|nr:hypothetical protein IAD21_03178 [Abditibacteriota bacterium]
MLAIEVWINGEKKCVAGTNDNGLTTIVNASQNPNVWVGGLVEKDGNSFHLRWLTESLEIGDEVRIHLIEADEVDAPLDEVRFETQAEKDEKARSLLREVQAMLSSSTQETEDATITLFEERLEQQNFVASMHILSELGEKNLMPASYWKDLGEVAFQLGRYEEGRKYREKERALTPQDEESQ